MKASTINIKIDDQPYIRSKKESQFKEVVAAAGASPGEIKVGGSGLGSEVHLLTHLLGKAAEVELNGEGVGPQ